MEFLAVWIPAGSEAGEVHRQSEAMTTVFAIVGFLVLGAVCSGCRTTVVRDVPPAVTDFLPTVGTITLIRIELEPATEELLVYTNGTLLAVIGNHSYVTLELSGGSHILTLDWGDTRLQFEEEMVLDLMVNKNMYLSVRHKFDIPEISRTAHGKDYTMVERLAVFEASEAFGSALISRLDPEDSYVFEADE